MRINHYQSGEAPRPGFDPAVRQSFGRIAARRPARPAPIHLVAGRPTPATLLTADVGRLEAAAHAAGARLLGEFVAAAWRGAVAAARRVLGEWQRGRQCRATVRALRGLDDRALRDLGIDRGEILSVAMGTARDDETRRLRTTRAANSLQLF